MEDRTLSKFINFKKLEQKILFVCLAISLFFHLGIILSKIDLTPSTALLEKQEKRIKLVLSQPKTEIEKQIVNTEKAKNKLKPKEKAFLGKNDQSFDRQVVSKRVSSFKETGKGVKDATEAQTQTAKKAKTQKVQRKVHRKGKISFNDIALTNLKPDVKKMLQTSQVARGAKNGKKGTRGLSSTSDFVEEIPLGDITNLNTIEYKYFGFYDRIRKRLELYWGNSLKEKAKKLYSSGRRLPASDNHITSLVITIDQRGNITNVQVKSTSGISELDEAAIESFNKAGPFPNPPKGMVESGHAKIEWGFVVKG